MAIRKQIGSATTALIRISWIHQRPGVTAGTRLPTATGSTPTQKP